MKDTAAEVIGILKDRIDALEFVDLGPATRLISSGFAESYEIIDVISELERHFGISIQLADVDLEDFDTAESIAGIVDGCRKEAR